ncbi:hypothetical protein FSARC_1174 [Fusarium sarcochroum]|uniref:Uncharacterized protein n=1 Tax=Fusarium sarcochroum TaxID=1208366 RepID=A0A8H4U9Y3_9HYPO|nr:hypothetical protein FSARC_1174 [Fusarium sarcochroum]
MFGQVHDDDTVQPGQTIKDARTHSMGTLMIMNNLEITKLSDQVSKITEILADAKIAPRSSKASSHRSPGGCRRSARHDDDEVEDAAAAAVDAADEAIESFITSDDFYSNFEAWIGTGKYAPYLKRTKNALVNAKDFRKAADAQVQDLWDPETLDDVLARLRSFEDDQLVELYVALSKRHRAAGKGKGKDKGKGKEVSTVTLSFRTDLDREPSQETEVNTPHNRVEKRKTQTLGGERRVRGSAERQYSS